VALEAELGDGRPAPARSYALAALTVLAGWALFATAFGAFAQGLVDGPIQLWFSIAALLTLGGLAAVVVGATALRRRGHPILVGAVAFITLLPPLCVAAVLALMAYVLSGEGGG